MARRSTTDFGRAGRVAAPLALALSASAVVANSLGAASLQEGYRRYQAVCGHCHGPDGVGSSFAPGLIDPLPSHDDFSTAVLDGVRGQKGTMRGFADDPNVAPYLDDIYAYLAARATGELGRGRPRP